MLLLLARGLPPWRKMMRQRRLLPPRLRPPSRSS